MPDQPVPRETPQLLISTRGRGKEICDRLRAELGIPDDVIGFSVAFRVDETVKVTIEQHARAVP